MKCPGCNGALLEKGPISGTCFCAACGGLVTTRPIYKGESYGLVKPFFTKDPTADERAIYFDLETLGSDGLGRRHGWFCPETKLLVQVG